MMLKKGLATGEVEGEGEEVDDFMYFFLNFFILFDCYFFKFKV